MHHMHVVLKCAQIIIPNGIDIFHMELPCKN